MHISKGCISKISVSSRAALSAGSSVFLFFFIFSFLFSPALHANAFSLQPGQPSFTHSPELQTYVKTISSYHPETKVLRARLQKHIAYYKKVHILKTINKPQFTIDCIPFAEQPALIDHPTYANNLLPQIIQTTQGALPELKKLGNYFDFNPAESCPLGSVAILRPTKNMLTSEKANRKIAPLSNTSHNLLLAGYTWQVGVDPNGDLIHILTNANQAYFKGPQNQYIIPNNRDDHSLEQFWLIDKYELRPRAERLHTVEFGLMASSYFTPVASTGVFVFASVDHYGPNSCYNVQCPNFIQAPGSIPLGVPIATKNADFIFQVKHIETPGFDPGYYLTVVIHDTQLGRNVGANALLGYYPNNLFPPRQRPKFFSAGAEVYADAAGDGTQMYANYANPFSGFPGPKTIGQFTEINNLFPYSMTTEPAPYGLIWKLGQG